jgi:hypothetical protein
MGDKPYIIEVVCASCKKTFTPYGNKPRIPMMIERHTCPYCKKEVKAIFDEELEREMLRKELGLDKKLEIKIDRLTLDNKTLKQEIEWLKKQVMDNSNAVGELAKYTDDKIVAMKKYLANQIAEILGQNAKKRSVKPI